MSMIKSLSARRTRTSLATFAVCAAISLVLSGCGRGAGAAAGAGIPEAGEITGTAHGGYAPIIGGTATLYQSQNNGYGGAGAVIATTTTDGNGAFGFTTGATCTTGSAIYVTISNGNSGAAANNGQILEMAPVELCTTGVTVPAFTSVNELSTVASAYALGNFMSITGSPSAPVVNMSAPPNNNYSATSGAATPTGAACTAGSTFIATGSNNVSNGTTCTASGLQHAFTNVGNLVNYSAGSLTANTKVPANTTFTLLNGSTPSTNNSSTVPAALINTIADVLQSCVNSQGGSAGTNFSAPTPASAGAGSTSNMTLANSTAAISGTLAISFNGTSVSGAVSGTGATALASSINGIAGFTSAGLVASAAGNIVTITGPVGAANTLSFSGTSLSGSATSTTAASFTSLASPSATAGATSVLNGFSGSSSGVNGSITATLAGSPYTSTISGATTPAAFVSAFNSNSTFNTALPTVGFGTPVAPTASTGSTMSMTGFNPNGGTGLNGNFNITLAGTQYTTALSGITSQAGLVAALNASPTFSGIAPPTTVTLTTAAAAAGVPGVYTLSGLSGSNATATGSFGFTLENSNGSSTTTYPVTFTNANTAGIVSAINGSAAFTALPDINFASTTVNSATSDNVAVMAGFSGTGSTGSTITGTLTININSTNYNIPISGANVAAVSAAILASSAFTAIPALTITNSTPQTTTTPAIYTLSGFSSSTSTLGGTFSFTFNGVSYSLPVAAGSNDAAVAAAINTDLAGMTTAIPTITFGSITAGSGTTASTVTMSGLTTTSGVNGNLTIDYPNSSTPLTCAITSTTPATFVTSFNASACGTGGLTAATTGTAGIKITANTKSTSNQISVPAMSPTSGGGTPILAGNSTSTVTITFPTGNASTSNIPTSLNFTATAASSTIFSSTSASSVKITTPSGTANAPTFTWAGTSATGTLTAAASGSSITLTSPSGVSNVISTAPTFTVTSATGTLSAASTGSGVGGGGLVTISGPSGTAQVFTAPSISTLTASNALSASLYGSNQVLISGPTGTANTLSFSGSTVTSNVTPANDTSTCGQLFAATPDLNGNIPTNTLQSAMNLAKNPFVSTANVNAIFNLLPAQNAFTPTLTAAPHDWTIAISYLIPEPYLAGVEQSGGFPWMIDTDADDNVYTATSPTAQDVNTQTIACIVSYGPDGTLRSGATDWGCNAVTGKSAYIEVEPDALGNLWTPNYDGSGVGATGYGIFQFSSSTGNVLNGGVEYAPASGTTRLYAIAIDNNNNIFFNNNSTTTSAPTVHMLTNTFTTSNSWTANELPGSASGSPHFNGSAHYLALDPAGNIWAAEYGSASGTDGGSVGLIPSVTTNPTTYQVTTNPVQQIPISGGSVTAANGNSSPFGVAIDANSNVWVSNGDQDSFFGPIQITEIPATPSPITTQPATGTTFTNAGFTQPRFMEVDGANNLWVTDGTGYHEITNLSGTPTEISQGGGFQTCFLNYDNSSSSCIQSWSLDAKNLSIDAAGDVWTLYPSTSKNAGSIATGRAFEIIGTAFPTWPLRAQQQPGIPAGCTKSLASGCN